MTPQLAVGIASIVGAILFLSVGYLLAKARAAGALADGAPDGGAERDATPKGKASSIGPEGEATRKENAALRKELEALRAQSESSRAQSESLRADKKSMETQLERLSQERAELKSALDNSPFALKPDRQGSVPVEAGAPSTGEADAAPDARVTSLESENQRLSDQLEQAQNALSHIEAELDQVMRLKHAAEAEKVEAVEKLEAFELAMEEQGTIRASAADFEQDPDEEKTVAGFRLADMMAALEADLGAAKSAKAKLEMQLAERERELEDARADLEKATGADRTEQAQAENLEAAKKARPDQKENHAAKIAALEQSLEARAEEHLRLKEQLEAREEEHLRLKEQLEAREEERLRLKEQVAELEEKAAATEALGNLDAERQERLMTEELLKGRESERQAIAEEKTRLAMQLEEAVAERQELVEKLQTLEAADSERQDLALELVSLQQQIEELERLREENAKLRAVSEDATNLRKELEQSEAENSRLRSLQLHQESPPRPAMQGRAEGLGASLQSLLERLSDQDATRGAVLADPQGLLVAGTGNHTEGLAAVAAIFDDLTTKLPSILPLSKVQQLTVVDENSITFVAQPFLLTDGQLVLSTLSVGPGPERSVVDRLIRESEGSKG